MSLSQYDKLDNSTKYHLYTWNGKHKKCCNVPGHRDPENKIKGLSKMPFYVPVVPVPKGSAEGSTVKFLAF